MLSNSLFFLRSIALLCISSVVFGATPAIGIVTAAGHFMIEKSQVWGNSSLFDGSTIQTDQASSDLALRNGVKVQLGAKSRAQIFEKRLALEKGTGQVNAASAYEVDAAGLKITGERVRVSVSDRVEVVSFAGAARVMSGSGTLLAAIPAGRAMTFAMQAGSTAAMTRTGCLVYKDGHYLLQDENTQEVIELTGPNLAANTGNRVEATGTAASGRPSISAAAMLMNVTAISTKSQGGCLSVASALDAKAEAPAGSGSSAPASSPAKSAPVPKASGGGMSTGAKVAIVAAIAGGGAGAALAVSGKKSSTSP
ncbi:MAG: hypothetical protein LAO79_25515 [Acidobacteriia bacterium]|nr:hypothetical protein [Terriglobia bacterium]